MKSRRRIPALTLFLVVVLVAACLFLLAMLTDQPIIAGIGGRFGEGTTIAVGNGQGTAMPSPDDIATATATATLVATSTANVAPPYHHERFDGVGNPHGLEGEGIPLLARIVAIAQAFDNLTVDIPGHQPTSIEDAIRQILLEADTRFDPKLAELFAQVVRECKSSLPALAIAKTSPAS